MHAAWPAKRDSLFSSCSNLVAVFACESTDEKTDEHLKSRRRAEQMRITDSVAMAARRRRTRIWVGRGREEFLLTLRAKKNHAKESDETGGWTHGRPRCRQQREGVVRQEMLTGTLCRTEN